MGTFPIHEKEERFVLLVERVRCLFHKRILVVAITKSLTPYPNPLAQMQDSIIAKGLAYLQLLGSPAL